MKIPTRMVSLALALGVVGLCGLPVRPAHGAPENKSREVLDSWLANVKRSMSIKVEPKIIPIEDGSIQKVFPEEHFYGVYFPRWPVAVRLPAELSYETIICVRHNGSVEPIRNWDALKTFFEQFLADIKSEPQARAAILASLRLAEAGAEGGPYQLEKPDISVVQKEENIVATARAAVQEPSRGKITIRIEFSADGRVVPGAIEIGGRPRPGPP